MRNVRCRTLPQNKSTGAGSVYGTDPRRPDEVATLARMRELRAEGLSCYAIAKRLSVEGLNPRKAAKWSRNGVAKILDCVVPSAPAQANEPQNQKPR
jgi:hypothetical protein